MRTITLFAVWLLPALAVAQAPAPPLELKGLYPGQALADAASHAPGLMLSCGWASDSKARQTCYYRPPSKYSKEPPVPALETVAGRATISWFLMARDGALASLTATIHSNHFDSIAAALREKFGQEESREASTIQNRAGASFDQVELEWRRGDRTLMLKKRAGKVDTGRIYLVSDQELRDSKAEREKGAKEAAKDL